MTASVTGMQPARTRPAQPPLRAGPVRIGGWALAANGRHERQARMAMAALEFLARDVWAETWIRLW